MPLDSTGEERVPKALGKKVWRRGVRNWERANAGNASLSKTERLSLSNLQTEYDSWLRTNRLTVHQSTLKLIDPITGALVVPNDATIVFELKAPPVKVTDIEDRSLPKSERCSPAKAPTDSGNSPRYEDRSVSAKQRNLSLQEAFKAENENKRPGA